MSSMQNYLSSRSPCGNQGCDDKPTDGDIRHKGRVHDKVETQRELRLEEACLLDHYDTDYQDEDPEWVDYEAPFTTQTRYY